MRGRGGPITAAVDGPGGPILAGNHRRRDSAVLAAFSHQPWMHICQASVFTIVKCCERLQGLYYSKIITRSQV